MKNWGGGGVMLLDFMVCVAEKVLFALTMGRRESERDMASEALLLSFRALSLPKHPTAVSGKAWF